MHHAVADVDELPDLILWHRAATKNSLNALDSDPALIVRRPLLGSLSGRAVTRQVEQARS